MKQAIHACFALPVFSTQTQPTPFSSDFAKYWFTLHSQYSSVIFPDLLLLDKALTSGALAAEAHTIKYLIQPKH